MLETDDAATIVFGRRGYGRHDDGGRRWLVGSMTYLSSDEWYHWLNDVVCAVAGETQPSDGGLEVVLDGSALVWESLPA